MFEVLMQWRVPNAAAPSRRTQLNGAWNVAYDGKGLMVYKSRSECVAAIAEDYGHLICLARHPR